MENLNMHVNESGTVYAAGTDVRKVTTREVASLVLGIISLYPVLSGSIPVLGYFIALIVGIVGVVMGNRARKEAAPGALMGSAGYGCSMIGVVISTVMVLGMIIIAITAGVALSGAATSLPDLLSQMGM